MYDYEEKDSSASRRMWGCLLTPIMIIGGAFLVVWVVLSINLPIIGKILLPIIGFFLLVAFFRQN